MIDERIYTVNTTEELFNKFTELESEMRSLKAMYQNTGMEVTGRQLEEYEEDVKRFKNRFNLVIEEGRNVIEQKK